MELIRDNRFAEKVIRAAFKGEKGLVEPSYVYLPGVPGGDAVAKQTGVDFFSVPIELGVSILSKPPQTNANHLCSPRVPRRPRTLLRVSLTRRRVSWRRPLLT